MSKVVYDLAIAVGRGVHGILLLGRSAVVKWPCTFLYLDTHTCAVDPKLYVLMLKRQTVNPKVSKGLHVVLGLHHPGGSVRPVRTDEACHHVPFRGYGLGCRVEVILVMFFDF